MTTFATILVLFCLSNAICNTTASVVEDGSKVGASNDDIMEAIKHIVEHMHNMDQRMNNMDGRVQDIHTQVQHTSKTTVHLAERMKELKIENISEDKKIMKNSYAVEKIGDDIERIKDVLTGEIPGKTESTPAASCQAINARHYGIKNGRFWVKEHGQEVTYKYCKMNAAGIPPSPKPVTTNVPPTTVQPVHHNMTTCKTLKERHPHLKSGLYNISIDGETFEAFCDMETDEGGWLMFGHATIETEDERHDVDYRRIQSSDITQLSNVTAGRFLLSTQGLNKLFPFQELRIKCSKAYHGRTVDIKTAKNKIGRWVVERFLHKQMPVLQPPSCGSFTALATDSSFIGGHCDKWTGGRWFFDNLYEYPMYAAGEKLLYTISLLAGRAECDDNIYHPHYTSVGQWSYFVR